MPHDSVPTERDFRTRDDQTPLMTAGLLVKRDDLSPDLFTRYWRDVHGPLAARIHGFDQYWQHHLGAPRESFWPTTEAIAQTVEGSDRINGMAETTFRSAADRSRLGEDPAAQLLFHDERNVFGATYLCPSATGDSVTLLDRFIDPAPQGGRGRPCYLVLIRRRAGVDAATFTAALRNDIAPALAEASAFFKVRIHVLMPYDASAWNTPGVRHDLPADRQYHAILEIAFRDTDAQAEYLQSAECRSALARADAVIGALHTYPIEATYTEVYDGRPTLVGLKGLSAAETIMATNAENQMSDEVLRLLHGTSRTPRQGVGG